MKWFMHQAQAHRDMKLKKVLMKYGAEGYGLYWYCIEQICTDLEPRLTFELEHDSEILAHELAIDTRKVEEMMLYMVNIGLFEESSGVIRCLKLASHLGDNLTRNEQLKTIIKQSKSQTVSDNLRLSQQEEKRGEEKRGEETKTYMSSVKTDNRVPASEIVSIYHEVLPELPSCKKLTETRRSYIKQRWLSGDLPSLENWRNYFEYVRDSDFLMGKTAGRGDRPPFKADLEWLSKPSNFAKVYEEKYHGV